MQKAKTKNNTFYKAKTCFNSSNLIFVRGWNDKTYIKEPHRSTLLRAKWAKFTQTFFASASKLPDFISFFLSMCACHLFKLELNPLKIRNKAVWSRAKSSVLFTK